jgi:hypothetical protein
MVAGRAASVVAAALVGIMAYDADGDRRCRRCPHGVAMVDVMMTMASERGGEMTARQQQGDYKATTGCEGNWLWRRRWQGQQGIRQEHNK